MKHERETLDAVVKARNSAVSSLDAAKVDRRMQPPYRNSANPKAHSGRHLGGLFALSEAYPDLKANQNMMQFQEELTTTENKVAFSRQAFNDSVLAYNNKAENFPNSVIAGMFNFELASFLEIESPEKRRSSRSQFHVLSENGHATFRTSVVAVTVHEFF